MKIGVTGHRTFDDAARVRAAVSEQVAHLARRADRPIEVWSSLAEGADRLVADAVLAGTPGARLVAVLPLAADDYRSDFAAPESRAEFDRLLDAAAETRITGPDSAGTRESAYLRAGLAVVDATDVLIAVWDGAPARGRGGTAEIVAAARAAGREVVVIPVTRPAGES